MAMRAHLVILPLMVIASTLLAMVPMDPTAADVNTAFDDGVLKYETIDSDTVAVIGYIDTSGVSEVVVPAQVKQAGVTYKVISISFAAFEDNGIISVTIPNTVEEVYAESFIGINIQRIDVDPDNTHYASIDGILYDYKIRSLIRCPSGYQGSAVETPESLAAIGRGAFDSCTVETVKLNDGLILIDINAFFMCKSLSTITVDGVNNELPMTVSTIGSYAFGHCESLERLYLPENLTFIGDSAFSDSGLTELTIPSGVDYIGQSAFGHCKSLKSIESDNMKYISENGVLFHNSDLKRLFCYPAGKEDAEYTIPDDISTISHGAFAGCINLKKVNIGSMTVIPDGAFAFCTSLEEIDLTKVTVIGTMAFYECDNLRNVSFGSSLSVIDVMAFYSSGIEEMMFPPSLISIGSSAFMECRNLKNVTFPESSQCMVDAYVFWKCYGLSEIYIGSSDVTLENGSLIVSTSDSDAFTLNITVPKGYSIPEDAYNTYTDLIVTYIGERPYPYENIIGVVICLIVLFAIFKLFRRV